MFWKPGAPGRRKWAARNEWRGLPEDELPEPQEETLQGLDNEDLNEEDKGVEDDCRLERITILKKH